MHTCMYTLGHKEIRRMGRGQKMLYLLHSFELKSLPEPGANIFLDRLLGRKIDDPPVSALCGSWGYRHVEGTYILFILLGIFSNALSFFETSY